MELKILWFVHIVGEWNHIVKFASIIRNTILRSFAAFFPRFRDPCAKKFCPTVLVPGLRTFLPLRPSFCPCLTLASRPSLRAVAPRVSRPVWIRFSVRTKPVIPKAR